MANGYVSITPVHLDMTHYPSLQKLKNEGAGGSDVINALGGVASLRGCKLRNKNIERPEV